jgi:hypothetical protein
MKASLLILCTLALLSCGRKPEQSDDRKTPSGSSEAPYDSTRKYGVKSGIVRYTSSFMHGTSTYYFDDYGAKEAMYSEADSADTLPSFVSIIVDTTGWIYDSRADTGLQQKVHHTGRLFIGSIVPVWHEPERMWSTFEVQRLEPKQILGKEAQGYSFNYEGPQKVWVWNDIPLYMEDLRAKPPAVVEAKSLELDVPIPPEKFEVPATVKLRK